MLSTELSTASVDCRKPLLHPALECVYPGFTSAKKGVECPPFPLQLLLMSRALPRLSAATSPVSPRLPMRVALWLLDSPRFGQAPSVKRFAGQLLKQPARQGVVLAQSRLGQLLCRDCGNTRDRRIGLELLRQAARSGDRRAQLELGRLYSQPRSNETLQARHWLELAAAQGSTEARQLLSGL